MVWKNNYVSPIVCWYKANVFCNAWWSVNIAPLPAVAPSRVEIWRPPPSGWLKLNVDIATGIDNMYRGIGIGSSVGYGLFFCLQDYESCWISISS